MPNTPAALIEIATRRQIYIEGYKSSVANKFDPFLVKMSQNIEKRLAGKDLTAFTTKRLEMLLSQVRSDMSDQYGRYYDVWNESVVDISLYEAEFEVKSLKQIIDNREFTLPSKSQLRAAVFMKPLSGLQGADKSLLLPSFYKGWTDNTIKTVEGIIQAGFYQGRTTPQIIREIKGTAGAGFRDGQLARGKKDITMLTRTSVQHAAAEARNETWKQNSDIVKGYEIVATLDRRTTTLCRSLDGEIFPIDGGPLPPFHPGCRTTTAASLDSRFSVLGSTGTRKSRDQSGVVHDDVSAKSTYYDWLKTQPASFQDSIIGPNRGKLLREGGLSSKRFAELDLDKAMYKPRTLAEMRELEPIAFEKAGI